MSKQSRPVVVGVADDQPAVLQYAAIEAERRGRPLRIVHCWSLPALGAEFVVAPDASTAMRTDAERVLDQARTVVTQAAPTVESTYVVEYGGVTAILAEEARTGSELVIGADDIPWFERFLDGELSSHLARVAACPVAVVPEEVSSGSGDGGVVVAIDGKTSAVGPLRYAFEQADLREVELHVIYAAPAGTLDADLEMYRATQAEVVAGWQEQFPGVQVLRSTSSGGATEACIEATASAAVLILGRPQSHSPLALIRPVARAVLRRAECPVVVVPLDYGTAEYTSAEQT
ncbi:universal stress protein [Aeromicrobium sp. CF3.5]|uniref:universal stress protein n=1 Tax=Aeromicrobium sp. CF3.5 TaxID=3373078 RepID=UPI003EE42DE9